MPTSILKLMLFSILVPEVSLRRHGRLGGGHGAERKVLVAPTYDLTDKIYREMVIIVAQHLRHRIVAMKDNEKRLILRNMAGGLSEIRGKSADNPVSLLGEGLDWVIVDEAARLKPQRATFIVDSGGG